MSYLNPSRFSFSGLFQADVSTVNNIPSNYGENEPKLPVWNPDGTGRWAFEDCTVTSAVTDNCPDSSDPLLEMSVTTSTDPAPAKLVDLDTQQQAVSQVWGMKLTIGDTCSDNWLTGTFRAVAFVDMWGRSDTLPGSAGASACYQSVLEDVEWGPNLTSPVLKALAKRTQDKAQGLTKKLSIKFNVDMHDNFAGAPPDDYPVDTYPFTFGRVVGTIGPCEDGEPCHFVSGRLLRPTQDSSLYFAPCVVDGEHIFVDLGNSTPTNADGSIKTDPGNLRLALLNPEATNPTSIRALKRGLDPDTSTPQHIFPQALDYANYETDASIQAVPYVATQVPDLNSAPLGIVEVDDQGNYLSTLLAEASDGWFARADAFVFRFNPGDPAATVNIRATCFGEPAPAGTEIQLQKARLGNIGQAELQALCVPSSTAVTGADGWAQFEMSASDPGYPRQQGKRITYNIDGQIYGVTPVVSEAQNEVPDPWLFVSVLIFTDWSKVANNFDRPTWKGDVQQVLGQYGWLYPYMNGLIGLDQYKAVVKNIEGMLTYMDFAEDDPRHMPVTRDLSASKLQLIKNWHAHGMPFE